MCSNANRKCPFFPPVTLWCFAHISLTTALHCWMCVCVCVCGIHTFFFLWHILLKFFSEICFDVEFLRRFLKTPLSQQLASYTFILWDWSCCVLLARIVKLNLQRSKQNDTSILPPPSSLLLFFIFIFCNGITTHSSESPLSHTRLRCTQKTSCMFFHFIMFSHRIQNLIYIFLLFFSAYSLSLSLLSSVLVTLSIFIHRIKIII